MSRDRLVSGVASCLLLAAAAATAQERMEVFAVDPGGTSAVMAEVDVGFSHFGTVRQVTPVVPASSVNSRGRYPGPMVALAGGRHLIWLNPGLGDFDGARFSVFDRRTRTISNPTFDTYARRLLADPIRPRVFVQGYPGFGAGVGQIVMYDAATQQTRGLFPASVAGVVPEVVNFDYAAQVDRLAVLTYSFPDGAQGVRMIDVATGDTSSAFPITVPITPTALRVSGDGRLVYLYLPGLDCPTPGAFQCLGFPSPIIAFDTATGREVMRSAPLTYTTTIVLDEYRGYLFVDQSSAHKVVLDSRTLATLADLTLGVPADYIAGVVPGRGNTGAYVVRTTGIPAGCGRPVLDALDLFGQRRASVDLLAAMGRPACSSVGLSPVLRPPPSPTSLAAAVAGRVVTLSWQNPGDTTDFELEIGFAPGTTALTVPVGAAAGAAFADVPPGAYYVRVRARNEIGRSLPSSDVLVQVP